MLKRITAILIAVLCVNVILVSADDNHIFGKGVLLPTSTYIINGFYFRNDEDTAILSGVTPEYSEMETLFLPNEIEGISNITIDKGAFGSSIKAKQIFVSNLVNKIREGAFAGCSNLNIINLPTSIESLEFPIIKNCSKLKYVILDKGFRYQLLDAGVVTNKVSKNPEEIRFVSEHSIELVTHLKNNGFKNIITSEQIKYQDIYIFMTECDSILNSNEIKICINGKLVDSSVAPIVINGRTMVPLRAVFQEMGAVVNWDDVNRVAKISMGNSEVEFAPDVYEMIVDGKKVILDVPPQIIDGRTLVPIRAISEALTCKVFWDEELKVVSISTSSTDVSLNTEDYLLHNGDTLKIYASSDYSDYINDLIERGYYIVSYNSYGDCILKNGNEYAGVTMSEIGVYILKWNSSDMDLTNVGMNMILMDSSNIGVTARDNHNNYNNNGFVGGSNNNYNTGNSGANLADAAILAEIASLESRIGQLQSRLNNIMRERNVRMYADGGWIYTYDHQAADAVREQIEDLQLRLNVYKQSLN